MAGNHAAAPSRAQTSNSHRSRGTLAAVTVAAGALLAAGVDSAGAAAPATTLASMRTTVTPTVLTKAAPTAAQLAARRNHVIQMRRAAAIHVTITPAMAGKLARLRQCESSGNYRTNTGNGFYGAYQFDAGTWRSIGMVGLPHQAIPLIQDKAARLLQSRRGWQPWPVCGRRL